MSLRIVESLRATSPADAARLIGIAPQFITDSNLINVLNQYDLNSKKNDAQLMRTLQAFAGIPSIKEQVSRWLQQ
jgi:hypothetical protein